SPQKKPPALKARLTFGLGTKRCMNRASALVLWGIKFVGRCPTFATANPSCGGLQLKIAPLALNRAKVKKLERTTHYFLWSRYAPSNAPTLRLIAPSFSPSRGRDAF